MIVAQLMLVCSVVKYIGLLGLSCHCGGNDFVPDREAGGHLGSPLGCTDQMTTGPKVLPDVAESKEEPLSLPGRGEAFHYPFPDPGRLMGVLSPVEFSTDVKCCDESGGRT